MGVLGSLIANCTVLSLSLALPLWAAPASGPLLPASAGLSAHLSAFYIFLRFVSWEKILALTRQVKLGWGCLLVLNFTPPEFFRAPSRESSFTPTPISDLSGAVFGNITPWHIV